MLKRFIYRENLLLILVILFSTLIYTFIGVNKHFHFQTFGWDTAFFIQQLYFTNQLQLPFTSIGKMNALADHFHIVFLVTGTIFYKFWPRVEVLFFIQSLVVSLSAFPFYLISKHILSQLKISKLYLILIGLTICLMYLFSVPMQGLLTDEFHNDPLATLPLLFAIYFHLTKNHKLFFLSLIILLLTKETYGLYVVVMGIYIILTTKEFKKGLAVMLLGILVFYVLVYQIMPSLAPNGQYFHFNETNRPSVVINKLLNNPILIITELVNTPEKQKTILSAFLSLGFLPLVASPVHLLLPLVSIMIRFYDQSTVILYQFNNHYAAPLMPFMAVAAIFGIKNIMFLSERFKIKKIIILFLPFFILGFTLFQSVFFHGNVNSLAKKSFYQYSDWEKDAHELIQNVPKQKVIASQNSLLPHLALRDNYFLLPDVGNAEFIAVDLHEGPNKFAPLGSAKEMRLKINELIISGSYKIIWQKNEAILLRRNNPVDIN